MDSDRFKKVQAEQATNAVTALQKRYGVTQEQLREQIKPLFMFMLDHGISTLAIDRDGNKCLVSIDGQQI